MHTLTSQLDSVCASGNADGLVVVVGFEIVGACAFVGVVLEVGHCDGQVDGWIDRMDRLEDRYVDHIDCDADTCLYLCSLLSGFVLVFARLCYSH